jgi:hypothetical protein
MHVRHLRSMIIGELIQDLLRFCEANVIRDNYLGNGDILPRIRKNLWTNGFSLGLRFGEIILPQ